MSNHKPIVSDYTIALSRALGSLYALKPLSVTSEEEHYRAIRDIVDAIALLREQEIDGQVVLPVD